MPTSTSLDSYKASLGPKAGWLAPLAQRAVSRVATPRRRPRVPTAERAVARANPPPLDLKIISAPAEAGGITARSTVTNGISSTARATPPPENVFKQKWRFAVKTGRRMLYAAIGQARLRTILVEPCADASSIIDISSAVSLRQMCGMVLAGPLGNPSKHVRPLRLKNDSGRTPAGRSRESSVYDAPVAPYAKCGRRRAAYPISRMASAASLG